MPDWLTQALTPWWPSVAAFLRMGKHGVYVWSAYGLCALALALEWWRLSRAAGDAPAGETDEGSQDL
ncbi:MAG: heme exporter protein CcmD [Pseudomonadota bacterium]|nr:heme exporter protein CcmD [Pseudomonadota bacterium]